MTFLHAVNRLERACLAEGYVPTSRKDFRDVTHEESHRYYNFLRAHAPGEAAFLPFFQDLTHVPLRIASEIPLNT